MSHIKYYTAPGKLYFSTGAALSSYDLTNYTINGKTWERTHSPFWGCVDGETSVREFAIKRPSKQINPRYEIIDPMFVIEGVVPAVIPYNADLEDEDGEWHGIYAKYHKMYEYKYDMSEPTFEPIEFTAEKVGDLTIEESTRPIVNYTVYSDSRFSREPTKELNLGEVAQYSDLDQMLQDPLLIHNVPCRLTPKVTYDIIRHYVKQHIDNRYAYIDSNYDFCFKVCRKIGIKPLVIKTEQTKSNGKSYARPKFTSHTKTFNSVPVFEMTGNGYKGYTQIQGFAGDSLRDLADNVQLYLDELMAYINTPVQECECCKGTGMVLPEAAFPINKR